MSPLIVTALLATLIATAYFYVKHIFSYWKRRGIPFVEPSFPFGNFAPTFKRSRAFGHNLHDLYNSSSERVLGVYATLRPALLLRDPKIIRDVFIKDFQSFWHRGFHYDESIDPLAGNLFSQSGEKWKINRTFLSPTFTSGKLKAMFNTIVESGSSLEKCLDKYAASGQEIEVREIFAQFTTNVIASVAFGIEVDCLKDPEHEFRRHGRQFFEPYLRNALRFNMSYMSPFLTKLFGLRFTDKEVTDFMMETIRQNLEYREQNNVFRKDFFQLLIQLRNSGKVQEDGDWATKTTSNEKTMSLGDITAQAYLFFIAGYESTSTTMSFCLYELAKDPEVQQKAYEEIATVLQEHDGKITYESLNQMKYLENCIDETLRMHPPFDFISRQCTQDYKIADSDMIIEKGTPILISVTGPQYDAKYYDQPNRFMPERFADDTSVNKNSIETPYLSFGDGPRNCIGMRLGKMQSKIGVCLLLRKFAFDLGKQHINKELELDPRCGVRAPINGIDLKIKSRS